jgi:nicotinic acid mononucleotide adenylyltransferase
VPRVMLLCGADLLATIAKPGVWVDPDVILRDHGIVCICRQGTDLGELLEQPGTLLHKYRWAVIWCMLQSALGYCTIHHAIRHNRSASDCMSSCSASAQP